ncbi:MAG: hypothetical protein N3B15_06110 [Planctomycetota bacterium]|nr:hypothetical protein [Planctomycetota bacterium]
MKGFHASAALLVVVGLLLAALANIAGVRERSVWSALSELARDAWGRALLVDVGLSVLFVGAWMCAVERRPLRLLVWLPLLGIVGHMATALFLLDRLRRAEGFTAWMTRRL